MSTAPFLETRDMTKDRPDIKRIQHLIAGRKTGSFEHCAAVFDPATGLQTGEMSLASSADVDQAVDAARAALPAWRATSIGVRSEMMLNLREVIRRHRGELAQLATAEMGKTLADAAAEVDRGVEILAAAANVGSWLGIPATANVSTGIDVHEIRQPLGVIAAVSPFNFPVMIPILQTATAIACGNTVVLKPSERDPSAAVRIGELYKEAGLPDGVFNVLLGDASAVERLLRHVDVAGLSFVGSSKVGRMLRETGVSLNKRVQAFGSGKNHMVVLPDADLDLAADAAVSAAYGAAGQRCMAVSVVVAVGSVGDALVAKIAERLPRLVMGSPSEASTQLGPMITREARDRAAGFLDIAGKEGAKVVVDGRRSKLPEQGHFLGASLIDHVTPGSSCHANEIFGPVLSVVRAKTYEEAAAIIQAHALGNGAAIFTRDGGVAKRFVEETEAGMVGVNVPIPFPVFYHDFGGWKDSAFTETKLFGPRAVDFCTRIKTVTTRWPDPSTSRVDLGFPSSR